jgi:hypothetical protein
MAFGGQAGDGVQVPRSGQGSVHFMFRGHLVTSPAPGCDGPGPAACAGGRGETVYARGGGVTTVGDTGAGWLAAGVVTAGVAGPDGPGEGLVNWSFTAGRDGPPAVRAATVIPAAARTVTASTTAHCVPVSLRSLVIRRLRTPFPGL